MVISVQDGYTSQGALMEEMAMQEAKHTMCSCSQKQQHQKSSKGDSRSPHLHLLLCCAVLC